MIVWLVLLAGTWSLAIYYRSGSRQVQAVPADQSSRRPTSETKAGTYSSPVTVGALKSRSISESSGLAASRTTPGVYWTHNDSGNGPFLFAFDASGAARGVWQVPGASSRDWEDMAAGPGADAGKSYLYIGDIGDNSETRAEIVVYRIPEPVVTAADATSTKKKPQLTDPPEIFRLRYPDGKHDAETLLVHPQTGHLYVVTKVLFENPGVYEASMPLSVVTSNTMKRVGSLEIPSLLGGFVTGGSISPDGTRVVLCDYFHAYELVMPKNGSRFDAIWKQSFITIDLGRRSQGEAIAYRLDSKALLATSEGRFSPIIQVERR